MSVTCVSFSALPLIVLTSVCLPQCINSLVPICFLWDHCVFCWGAWSHLSWFLPMCLCCPLLFLTQCSYVCSCFSLVFFSLENPDWSTSGSCLHAPVLTLTCIPYRKHTCGGGHLMSSLWTIDAVKQLCGGGAHRAHEIHTSIHWML